MNQPEWRLSGGAHVAARFMLESKRFHGVRSVDELRYVLNGYDESTEWPLNSGVSFTAGLAQKAWTEGFRMANQAEALMRALNDSWIKIMTVPRLSHAHNCAGRPTRTLANCVEVLIGA
jgi:hypothetical protein